MAPYIYAHIAAKPIITETLEEPIEDLGEHALIVEKNGFYEKLVKRLE